MAGGLVKTGESNRRRSNKNEYAMIPSLKWLLMENIMLEIIHRDIIQTAIINFNPFLKMEVLGQFTRSTLDRCFIASLYGFFTSVAVQP